MLTALKKDGAYLTLPPKMTASDLEAVKQAPGFLCPCCKSEVIIKAGRIKAPHFAHKHHAACQASSEPESAAHIKGKRDLFKWLSLHFSQVELEAYFPEIKRRADILVTSGGKRYAVEFQCSQIPESELLERTHAYESVGIMPVWILSSSFLKPFGRDAYNLSSFTWLFIRGSMRYPYIWFYHPEKERLSALKNIVPFSSKYVFAELTSAPLNQLTPLQAIPKKVSRFPYLSNWRKKREGWCLNRTKTASLGDPFFSNLYVNRLNPALFPVEIGQPVPGLHMFSTPAMEWQAWLYMELFSQKIPGGQVTLEEIIAVFSKLVQTGRIELRILPLLKEKEYMYPLLEYVDFLVMIGYLTKVKVNIFRMGHPFRISRTVDERAEMEELFYYKCKKMIERGYIHYNER